MHGITFTTKGALQKSALRQANERLILNAIRQNPAISRSDLARITGLSPSSITFIVRRLKQGKMLLEEKVGNHSQVGRRPTALRLVEDARLAVAVEVASTESRVALLDLRGRIVRLKTVAWHPNHAILAQRLHEAVRSILGRLRPKQALGVGVGLPGTIDRTDGRVIAAENLNWFNLDIGSVLRGRLTLPFYFENNAKLSALAERWFTEPGEKPLQDFVFVLPSGGLGTGIVTNGHLLQGASGMAGEFGHIVLHPNGRKCPCGHHGCLEQYASDKALCRLYAEEVGTETPDASAVVRKAREGDPGAARVLKKVAYDLGLGFANLVFVFDPEALVVGGYIAEGWDIVKDTVWQVMRNRTPQYALASLRVYPSRHATDSSLLGAASLVFSHFFTRFEHGSGDAPGSSVLMHAVG